MTAEKGKKKQDANDKKSKEVVLPQKKKKEKVEKQKLVEKKVIKAQPAVEKEPVEKKIVNKKPVGEKKTLQKKVVELKPMDKGKKRVAKRAVQHQPGPENAGEDLNEQVDSMVVEDVQNQRTMSDLVSSRSSSQRVEEQILVAVQSSISLSSSSAPMSLAHKSSCSSSLPLFSSSSLSSLSSSGEDTDKSSVSEEIEEKAAEEVEKDDVDVEEGDDEGDQVGHEDWEGEDAYGEIDEEEELVKKARQGSKALQKRLRMDKEKAEVKQALGLGYLKNHVNVNMPHPPHGRKPRGRTVKKSRSIISDSDVELDLDSPRKKPKLQSKE